MEAATQLAQKAIILTINRQKAALYVLFIAQPVNLLKYVLNAILKVY